MVMSTLSPDIGSWKWPNTAISNNSCSSPSSSLACSFSSCVSQRPTRFAVLGAGFAGLSVAWNLLQRGPKDSHICVDIYDDVGIGGGASGVAGGLLHPYSPKGRDLNSPVYHNLTVKLLWRGPELWKESLHLISIAERALINKGETSIIRRRGILRPAVNLKNMTIMTENAQNCIPNCRIELIDEDAAQKLVPNLSVPLNLAFYMPEALNVNAQQYLQGLYLACENLVNEISTLSHGHRELNFRQENVQSLLELAGDYDAVIICFGARAAFMPELSGKLPLRSCRGVIAQLQLEDDMREEYPTHSPSILSDAWLAVRGGRHMDLGSTWDWNSRSHTRGVTTDEASDAARVLVPKACSVYPALKDWIVTGAIAGLRAMPPLTAHGSLPILGSVDDYIGAANTSCKYWLFAGLGARGLLFHGWLGKVLARAVVSCDEGLIPREFTSWKCKS